MGLEDHAGDVIRKSRMGLGIPSEEVAACGQISSNQLAEFEEYGQTIEGLAFEAIADLLTLDGRKLRSLATGWEPTAHDVTQWHHLRQIETDDGGMAVNCFLVWDQNSGEAALFDTGWVLPPIQTYLEQHDLTLRHIFITHSHHDHIEALAAVRAVAPKALLHSNIPTAPKDQQLNEGDRFDIGGLAVTFRETPGHADDGVTYVVDRFPNGQAPVAVVGDAIFAGSIGGARNHFELARTKIRESIFSLPNDTLICPGHGPVTTVAEEKQHNPFFT